MDKNIKNCVIVWSISSRKPDISCRVCVSGRQKCSFTGTDFGIATLPNVKVTEEGICRRSGNTSAVRGTKTASSETRTARGGSLSEGTVVRDTATRQSTRKGKKTQKAKEMQEESLQTPKASSSKARTMPEGKYREEPTMSTLEMRVPTAIDDASIRGRAYTVFTEDIVPYTALLHDSSASDYALEGAMIDLSTSLRRERREVNYLSRRVEQRRELGRTVIAEMRAVAERRRQERWDREGVDERELAYGEDTSSDSSDSSDEDWVEGN